MSLVLAGWGPQGLPITDRDELQARAEFFAQLDRCGTLDIGEVGIWLPSREERVDLDFVVAHGTGEDVWQVVCDSVFASTFAVVHCLEYGFESLLPPADLRQAKQALLACSSREAQCGQRDPRRDEFESAHAQLVERDLAGPVDRQAEGTRDPIRRVTLHAIGDLIRETSSRAVQIQHRIVQRGRGGSGDGDGQAKQEFNQQDRSLRNLIQAVRLLQ